MISCVYHDRVESDKNTNDASRNYNHFSVLRKLDDVTSYPHDI